MTLSAYWQSTNLNSFYGHSPDQTKQKTYPARSFNISPLQPHYHFISCHSLIMSRFPDRDNEAKLIRDLLTRERQYYCYCYC